MMWGNPGNWWGWLLMTVGMLGFWALLIAVLVALVRGPWWSGRRRRAGAEEILSERFARGELDADEYREQLRVLREGTRSAAS